MWCKSTGKKQSLWQWRVGPFLPKSLPFPDRKPSADTSCDPPAKCQFTVIFLSEATLKRHIRKIRIFNRKIVLENEMAAKSVLRKPHCDMNTSERLFNQMLNKRQGLSGMCRLDVVHGMDRQTVGSACVAGRILLVAHITRGASWGWGTGTTEKERVFR